MACYPEMKHSEIFAVPVQQETKEAIQTRLEELLENNPEMQDFVDGYENSDGSVTGGIDEEEKKEDSPLFYNGMKDGAMLHMERVLWQSADAALPAWQWWHQD